jgi:predicted dinucleotide-binding enzyme
MNVAIIGTGNVGGALTRACIRAGHSVVVSSTNAESSESLARETGAAVAPTITHAVSAAEIVVLAVPYEAVAGIVNEVAGAINDKILIDVTNRFAATELNAPSNAEAIQSMAVGARVVKAFNTVFAGNQADPQVDGVQLDGFVAGDDEKARHTVLELVKSVGYRPIDVGPLAMSRALEGMGTLNIGLNMNGGWSWKSAWKLVGPLH